MTDIVESSVESGTHTTNGALKHYYSVPMRKHTGSQLSFFNEMSVQQKVLTDTDGAWTVDSNGSLMLIFQTREIVGDKQYYPRSFEDAFFYINRQFVIDNERKFVSLKCKNHLSDKNEDGSGLRYDAYALAHDCIKSKASFAMDILLNSKSNEGSDFSNWQIPPYIKEGLLWLSQDLKMK